MAATIDRSPSGSHQLSSSPDGAPLETAVEQNGVEQDPLDDIPDSDFPDPLRLTAIMVSLMLSIFLVSQ